MCDTLQHVTHRCQLNIDFQLRVIEHVNEVTSQEHQHYFLGIL